MPFLINSFKNILIHGSGKIILFLLLVFLTNTLVTTEFADYILFLNLFSLSLLFSTLGIPQYIIRSIKNGNANFYKIIFLSLLINLALSFIFILVVIFYSRISLNLSYEFLFIFFLLSAFNATLSSILHGFDKVLLSDFLEFFLKPVIISSITFLGYLFIVKQIDFNIIFVSYFIGQLVLFTALVLKISKIIKDDFKKIKNSSEKFQISFFFKSILFLGASSVLHIFNSRIDIFMINYYLDDNSIATYGLALQLFAIVNLPILAIRSIFIPKFYSLINAKDYNNANSRLNLIKVGIVYLHIFIIMLMVTVGKEFFILIFDTYYSYAFDLVLFYLLCNIIIVPFLLSEVILHSVKKEIFIPLYTLVSAVINIFLNIILINLFGIKGALLSTIICNFLVHFMMYFSIRKHHKEFKIINFDDFKKFHYSLIKLFKKNVIN